MTNNAQKFSKADRAIIPGSPNHKLAAQPHMALRYLRGEVRAKICGATPPTPTQKSEAPGIMPSTEARKSFRSIPFRVFGREPPDSRQLIIAELFVMRSHILALRERAAQLLGNCVLGMSDCDVEEGEPEVTTRYASGVWVINYDLEQD